MVEEVLQLIDLGGGEDPVEGDGPVGAALRPVRGQIQGVLPVPTDR